ncbi:type I-D CRISPR-associated protein Cas7/Csc2 [Ktedonobacter racemifer]|uniref:CRISPR-associated protein Csc2 n=1 Tax=Ktedonobacter racemifer DSM 44963 TaxID=485913 RepID=D6TCK1_KTERA|nr:type I-D CRISPR-associated protein Cas7/Csc2 [Ktedonobacter racemifer]EFH90018.1 CRISPR-associated protein Csc2 [Ktedonobacter racemifer DSM 44963]
MSMTSHMSTLKKYEEHLMDAYNNFPYGRYVSLIVIRKTESETIFRTEGSGEGLSKEIVTAGASKDNAGPLRRVVISKRKQTAVERRVGRELLREHKLLKMVTVNKAEQPCALNTNAPCGECIDCMVYGYAVGGGGAQKSRVMTDDAYSIGPASQVTGRRTFNATFDNGTMRNPLTGAASTSINEDEYVLPETHFLDIETLKDVTAGELQYVIGNILRSSRYGAMSSRLGRVRNTLAAIIFSDTEIFSNLELTQHVYDSLKGSDKELAFPLSDYTIKEALKEATNTLIKRVVGRLPVIVRDAVLEQIIDETISLYRSESDLLALLQEIDQGYTKQSK